MSFTRYTKTFEYIQYIVKCLLMILVLRQSCEHCHFTSFIISANSEGLVNKELYDLRRIRPALPKGY